MSCFPLLSNPVRPLLGVLFFMCYKVHHIKPTTLVIVQSTKWTWRESTKSSSLMQPHLFASTLYMYGRTKEIYAE